MDYVMTTMEEQEYNETGEMSPRLRRYWIDFLERLPEDLKNIALENGFKLGRYSLDKETSTRFSHNMIFDVPNAPAKFKQIAEEPENIVICMEDPI